MVIKKNTIAVGKPWRCEVTIFIFIKMGIGMTRIFLAIIIMHIVFRRKSIRKEGRKI